MRTLFIVILFLDTLMFAACTVIGRWSVSVGRFGCAVLTCVYAAELWALATYWPES